MKNPALDSLWQTVDAFAPTTQLDNEQQSSWRILIEVKDLTEMLESSKVDIESEYAQVALDNIRDTLRFILHDAGAVIDPDIQENDSSLAAATVKGLRQEN